MINYSLVARRVATGARYGANPKDEYAREAVQQAMAKMRPCTIGSVLLFLSNAYAQSPQNAIKEAAKAAGTPLVFGCCAAGLLTEDEWLLDVDGAVAMVFPQDLGLQPLRVLRPQGITPELIFTIASPNAMDIAIGSSDCPQFGSITTDEYGQGPYSVWQSGRIVEQEYSQSAFASHLQSTLVVSESIERLSPAMQINKVDGNMLLEVNEQSAFDNIKQHLQTDSPFDVLCAVSETNNPDSIAQGHYELIHVLSVDEENQTITLADKVKAGRQLFWARRSTEEATKSMQTELLAAQSRLHKEPEFALMFPNVSRGPQFFGGVDQDLESFKQTFPDTPLIGFYGNAEISPGFKSPAVLRHHSTVTALFA